MLAGSFYIMSTGTELTTGRSTDSNGPRIAGVLVENGHRVAGLGVFADDPDILETEIRFRLENPAVAGILITGGLGPTADDHTVDVLKRICQCQDRFDPAALQKLEERIQQMPGRFDPEFARRQVRIPETAIGLPNPTGMAPGILMPVQVNGIEKIIVAMPGFPQEMEPILFDSLLPELNRRFPPRRAFRAVFHVYETNESRFQQEFFLPNLALPSDFNWGVSAQRGRIKVFFESADESRIQELVQRAREMYGNGFLEFPAVEELHRLGLERGFQLGTAESCTGGLISKLITDRPGSSRYFSGSVISYSNEVKKNLLGVKKETLEQFGAVSDQVAREMALGLVGALQLDFGLSVTGIAGPGGGSEEKPVGTVFIACASKNGDVDSRKLYFPLDRGRMREFTAGNALHFFFRFIQSHL